MIGDLGWDAVGKHMQTPLLRLVLRSVLIMPLSHLIAFLMKRIWKPSKYSLTCSRESPALKQTLHKYVTPLLMHQAVPLFTQCWSHPSSAIITPLFCKNSETIDDIAETRWDLQENSDHFSQSHFCVDDVSNQEKKRWWFEEVGTAEKRSVSGKLKRREPRQIWRVNPSDPLWTLRYLPQVEPRWALTTTS